MNDTGSPQRWEQLDGLRGIAALVVVFSHATAALNPMAFFGAERLLENNLSIQFAGSPLFVLINGSFAVCIFFALSGFVISQSAANSETGAARLIFSRFLRLYLPAMASIALVLIIASLNLKSPEQIYEQAPHWWLKSVIAPYVTNTGLEEAAWQLGGKYFVNGYSPLNPVLWTMKIELIGSILLYAVFFVKAGKMRYSLTLLLGISAIFLLRMPFGYYLCFVGGSLLYIWRTALLQVPNSVAFGLLILGMLMGGNPYFSPSEHSVYYWPNLIAKKLGIASLIWPVGAITLMTGVLCSRYNFSILFKKICIFFGRISFAIYLIHLPLTALVLFPILTTLQLKSKLSISSAVVAYVIITIACSYAFTVLIDEPVVRMCKRIRKQGKLILKS